MSNIVLSQVGKLATFFGMDGDPKELSDILKATAFKSEVTDAQMSALLVVANQYKLNPFTKELYAFPDKQNGIIPVVGVDGWSRIINDHPDFDGLEFRASDKMVSMPGAKSECHEWMECAIYRKSRSKPTVVREYIDEVYRPPIKGKFGEMTGPWQTHPKRFLRHKALMQAARIAFGYGGIYDQDEAERIVESKEHFMGHVEEVPQDTRPRYPDDKFEENLPKWRAAIEAGKKSPQDIIATVESKYILSREQKTLIEIGEVTDAEFKEIPTEEPNE